jgi:DNA-binding CsgD family transcriptional regulator
VSTPVHPGDPLTDRELEVLHHVAAGRTNQQIATALHVSYHTITTHLGRIYTKLRAADRTHAVILAVRTDQLHLPGITTTDTTRSAA